MLILHPTHLDMKLKFYIKFLLTKNKSILLTKNTVIIKKISSQINNRESLKKHTHNLNRFHRGLSQKGKIMCGFDMDTINYFQEGEERYRRHKQGSEQAPANTMKAFRNNINSYFGRGE